MSSLKPMAEAHGQGTLERPVYSPGLLLEDEDLTSGVSYTQRLTQLLFRSLFGCGVICGLTVTARLVCHRRKLEVTVAPGVGLDGMGNPVEVPRAVAFSYDPGCDPMPPTIWVAACYKDRDCAPREVSCGCDGEADRAMTRRKAGFAIHLYAEPPSCACGCERPAPPKPPDCDCPPARTQPAVQTLDAPATGTGAGPDVDPAEWRALGRPKDSCYRDHVLGVCDCGCGCGCILLGSVTTTPADSDESENPALSVEDAGARRIRPMLIGMALEAARPKAT